MLFAVATAGILCGPLLASDPLALVPANVAGVLMVRDVQGATNKLNAFLETTGWDVSSLDLDDVGRKLGLEPGEWDPTKPVLLILTRPEFDRLRYVVAFTPKDAEAFRNRVGRRDGTLRRQAGAGGTFYLMMRNGVAFKGEKRKAVRMMRRVAPERSLAKELDPQQRALFADSDLLLHVSIKRWREKIVPFVMLGANVMKLGVAAQEDDSSIEGAQALVSLIFDGIEAAVDQMEATTLAVGFDGKSFHFTHYHRFVPGGSVATYLGGTRRHDGDIWTALPDQPFMMVLAENWQSPAGVEITTDFNRKILSVESVAAKIPPETRRRIIEASAACFGQMQGMNFMITPPDGLSRPIRIFGAYRMEDAKSGLEKMHFIQENAGKAMAILLPAEGYPGSYEWCRGDDLEYLEMRFDAEKMSSTLRRQLACMYGENVRFQQAVADPHHVVYSISEPPGGVAELVRVTASGRNVGQNPQVRKLLSRLPPRPHAVLLVDAGCALAAMPHMIRAGLIASGETPIQSPPENSPHPIAPGPLLGWAGVVYPNAFAGHLAIDADDAVKVVRLAKQMARTIESMK